MKNCCVIFQVIMKGECRRRNNSLPERRKLGIKVSRDTRRMGIKLQSSWMITRYVRKFPSLGRVRGIVEQA